MRLLHTLLALPPLLRQSIAYSTLSDSSLQALPAPGADFDINSGNILAPILQVRVPGTEGIKAVQHHFADFFRDELPDWKLEYQNSTFTTPVSKGKEVPFVNLIATRDPPWVQNEGEVGRLALVAHYDSKLTPKGFIGAIDSAAPCAMLLHAAKSIDAALTRKWTSMAAAGASSDDLEEHKGIQILLLDGEEAFSHWTHDDSVYGSRALADEWEGTMYPVGTTYASPIRSIDLFVLLDLLGSKDPRVPSYFKTTHWAYQHMADLEQRLRKVGMMKSSPNHASKRTPSNPNNIRKDEPTFLPEASKKDTDPWLGGMIDDDHRPFQQRGVEILHMIPNPFPSVWHTIEDDGEHLDLETCEDWAVLTTAFAGEWMELEGFMEAGTGGKGRQRDEL